jgi:hypothetical protein
MRIDRRPDGTLAIRANPLPLRALLVAFGVVVVGAVWLQEPRDDTKRVLALLGSLVPFAGAALLEKVEFAFDVAQRRLRWRRRSLFRGISGELGFDAISDAVVRERLERHSGTKFARETPAYYVALVTSRGDLRLSDRMYADQRPQAEIAAAIRRAIGRSSAAPVVVEEDIARLAAAGETITAIKLARERLGLGLTEAKQHVDALSGKTRPG